MLKTSDRLAVFKVFITRSALASLLLLVLMVLGGCGGGRRATLNGQATYGGEPIADGKLRLFPLEPMESAGAELAIHNGAFASGKNTELLAGRYRVEIRASQAVEGVEVASDTISGEGPLLIDCVPERYNDQSTLEVTLEQGENQHDFNLARDEDWELRRKQELSPEIWKALQKGK